MPGQPGTAAGRRPNSSRVRRYLHPSSDSRERVLAGDHPRRACIAIPTLPIAQFPELAPPQVTVGAFYNGANAETVESAVTIPLEQAINGVEGMQYMTSTSGNDGSSAITVTFDITRNLDVAAVDVQNRISQAEGRLPNEVKQVGISVTKVSSNFVLAAAAYAEKGEYDPLFISNYVDRFVVDEIKRVPGVGNVFVFGIGRYAMRLWVDPDKLAGRDITADEVVAALREQNVQVAAGAVGSEPAPKGQTYQISVRAEGRLNDPAQFEDIILKRSNDGALVRVRDVGRTELGAESYTTASRFNARDAIGFGVLQLPTANSLQVYRDVTAAIDRLSQRFPPGLKIDVAFDTTSVVSESIREVVTTLLEAIGLVVLVMFLFLQNWRTTLIPAITIPVSLIGTFAFVKLFGFSINTLTLFGITLATGLVVDDAIVVIENIERHIHDRHLKNRDHDAPVDTYEAVVGSDGRGDERGDRHRAGAGRGVRAGRVLPRHDRPALSAVRADDRRVDGDLGVQRADADAGALGAAPERHRQAEGRVLPRGQPRHRRRHQRDGVDAAPADSGARRSSCSCSWRCSAPPGGSTGRCRPASCPRKIRAT